MEKMKVSVHVGKKMSRKHNLADRPFDKKTWNKNGHIDYERSHLNENLVDMSLEELIDQECGDALAAYNEKNREKHPERLIGFESREEYEVEHKDKNLTAEKNKELTDKERREKAVKAYTRAHRKDAQECIMQLGDGEHYQKLCEILGAKKAQEIHKRYLKGLFAKWKKENKTFKVFGAYIHMDETTPHIHIDFIPIATSSRGLAKKVSMDGAIKDINADFGRDKSKKFERRPYLKWLDHQRDEAEEFARHALDGVKLPAAEQEHFQIQKSEPFTGVRLETRQYNAEKKLREAEKQKKDIDLDVFRKFQKSAQMAADINAQKDELAELNSQKRDADRMAEAAMKAADAASERAEKARADAATAEATLKEMTGLKQLVAATRNKIEYDKAPNPPLLNTKSNKKQLTDEYIGFLAPAMLAEAEKIVKSQLQDEYASLEVEKKSWEDEQNHIVTRDTINARNERDKYKEQYDELEKSVSERIKEAMKEGEANAELTFRQQIEDLEYANNFIGAVMRRLMKKDKKSYDAVVAAKDEEEKERRARQNEEDMRRLQAEQERRMADEGFDVSIIENGKQVKAKDDPFFYFK